jgi:hypothetical protein
MLQVLATKQIVVETVAPTSVHAVPIYLYKGSRDDMTGFLFDMEIDEDILVSEFKTLLAAKMMENDPTAFPDVDPTHLRVREFASNDPKWVGSIFMDHQKVIEPVSKFVGAIVSSGPSLPLSMDFVHNWLQSSQAAKNLLYLCLMGLKRRLTICSQSSQCGISTSQHIH